MKSLQDYIETYRKIASNLNIRGDSVELLIQLLANASYISEVENISYSQEASLEKASQMNSKIQHCVNSMYSVFRGLCPRVILNIKPLKPFSFNPYDEIVVGNTFRLYYIGYYDEKVEDKEELSYDTGIIYGPLSISPELNLESTKTYKIVCLLVKERGGVVDIYWVLNQDNLYYVDCLEGDLSNDLIVKISTATANNIIRKVTSEFSNHILDGDIFDLTLPAFGSRLYISGTRKGEGLSSEGEDWGSNTKIEARYFTYSTLDSYNESDLKRINLKGAELVKINETDVFWTNRNLNEFIPGVCLVKESPRDPLISTHYLANRSRYTNTIFRSNSDLGDLLERSYPSKIYPGGTKSIYSAESDSEFEKIKIYYIPKDSNNFLIKNEIDNFISNKKAYYVASEIEINRGEEYTAIFDIEVELYDAINVEDEIKDILFRYEKKFDTNFLNEEDSNELPYSNSCLDEIETLISKISNVKNLKVLNVSYLKNNILINRYSNMTGESNNNSLSDDYRKMLDSLNHGGYYTIECNIKSIL